MGNNIARKKKPNKNNNKTKCKIKKYVEKCHKSTKGNPATIP